MEQVYVFFVQECKPESLTGYAATKDSVLVQVSTLRSALQVRYQLGVTSKMQHNIYSKLGDFELSYIGGFDDQQQAFDTIQRLDAEKNQIKKEESLSFLETDETPKPEDQTSQNAVKEEAPVSDVTSEETKPFGPKRAKDNKVKGK